MAGGYSIELTDQARSVYERMYAEHERCIAAGDETNSKVTQFRMIEEILEKIIPHDPFNPDRALAGKLSNMFRVKKGRIRVSYIGSSKKRHLVVLYISDTPRKEGDVSDPYVILTNLIVSGKFDQFFDALGVRKPVRKGLSPPTIQ
jgi:mRNA-degrading endonuclease RelE of RelBE toxin-antitoxin system